MHIQAIDKNSKIKGIMSMYCVVFNKESNVVHTRFLSCPCDKCRTLDIDVTLQCTTKSTVGPLVKHVLKKQYDKQPPHKRRKTNSNLQGIA